MNHIFRVIFNHSLQCWQAVAEIGRRQHKTRSEKSATTTLSTPRLFKLLPLSALVALSLQNAFAAPQGGQVSAGQATITQQGKVTDIHQSSQNAAINWQKFDVAPKETVNFHQPNKDAITLNRVTGKEESVIQGAINAKGNVFISNPNGVLIGNNAQINVGSLVATTQEIKDEDLMNGKLKFDGQAGGKVENNADIRVPKGGVIALIAPIVKNNGKLTAFEGNVLLASAEKFSITLPKDNFSYTLDRGTLQGLVDNKGAILADGGRVVLTAKGINAVKKSVIKHSGVIEANTVRQQNGVIELLGDLDHSELQLSGTIKAEGKGKAPGGKVETSAAKLKISDKAKVSTKSEKGKTGKWTLDPKDFVVAKEGGDITGKQVSQFLASNDMELKSRDGKIQEGKGDVIINDEIAWDKNTLTLNAENDIKINQPLNGLGEAKLALKYGQGSSDGGSADYYVNAQVNLPAGKNFSIQKGENGERKAFTVYHQMPEIVKDENGDWVSQFTEKYIAFGKDIDLSYTKDYLGFAGWDTLSTNNSDARVNIDGLGHTLDKLTLDNKKRSYVGLFTTVSGDIRNTGVTNINISSSGKSSIVGGLVGIVFNNSTLSNSYATGNVEISGDYSKVGGLVGRVDSNSTLSNSYATGRVEASSREYPNVGGLVGQVDSNSTLSNSYATGRVEASGKYSYVGGLVGVFGNSTLGNSYATGNVEASGLVGGLVGRVYNSTLSNSYATGNVSVLGERSAVGGLVGIFYDSTLSNSYATGNVEASGKYSYVGGLVGNSFNLTLSNSYATGRVGASGSLSHVGGLVGRVFDNSTLSNGYATGRVEASGWQSEVGGLVGRVASNSTLSNSYATGSVEASRERSRVGGLVGYVRDNSTLGNSYATGRVGASGDRSRVGGLVGDVERSTLNHSYAAGNVEALGSDSWVGDLVGYAESNSPLNVLQKLTAPEIKKFVQDNWDLNNTWAFVEGADNPVLKTTQINPKLTWDPEIWRFDKGQEHPYLRAFTRGKILISPENTNALGIKANNLSKIYDGVPIRNKDDLELLDGWDENGVTVIGLLNGDTLDNNNVFNGKLRFDGEGSTWQGAVNAGQYVIAPTGLSSQKYEIEYQNGILDILKKDINLLAIYGTKMYDGSKKVTADQITDIKGLIGDDKLTVSGTGTLTSAHVGKKSLASHNFELNGKNKDNYTISRIDSEWYVTKRPLTIQVMNNIYPEQKRGSIPKENIGVLIENNLVEGEVISDVEVRIFESNRDKGSLGEIQIGEVTFSKGFESNYDIKKLPGKILRIQEDYTLNDNFKDSAKDKILAYKELLDPVSDALLLALAVYGDDKSKFGQDGTFYEITQNNALVPYSATRSDKKFELVKNHSILGTPVYDDSDMSGLSMALYKEVAKNDYYLVFRGSGPDVGDWTTNINQALFLPTGQYPTAARLASNIADKIQKNNLGNLTFVGHSLGGGLATYSAAKANGDIPVITVNAASLGLLSNLDIAITNNKYGKEVPPYKHFVFDNDFLDKIQPVGNAGTTYYIDLLSNDGFAVARNLSDHSSKHAVMINRLVDIMAENYLLQSNPKFRVFRSNTWYQAPITFAQKAQKVENKFIDNYQQKIVDSVVIEPIFEQTIVRLIDPKIENVLDKLRGIIGDAKVSTLSKNIAKAGAKVTFDVAKEMIVSYLIEDVFMDEIRNKCCSNPNNKLAKGTDFLLEVLKPLANQYAISAVNALLSSKGIPSNFMVDFQKELFVNLSLYTLQTSAKAVSAYFEGKKEHERLVVVLADSIYRRAQYLTTSESLEKAGDHRMADVYRKAALDELENLTPVSGTTRWSIFKSFDNKDLQQIDIELARILVLKAKGKHSLAESRLKVLETNFKKQSSYIKEMKAAVGL